MTKTVQVPYLSPHPCAMIRKKRLLELLPFSKTTLHAKLTEGGLYEDPSFPKPIYFPHSRTPFWREAEVLAWIDASASASRPSCFENVVRNAPTLAPAALTHVDVRQAPVMADSVQGQGGADEELRTADSRQRVVIVRGRRVVMSKRKQHLFKPVDSPIDSESSGPPAR